MSELAEALRDLKEVEVYGLVEEKINQGISPLKIIKECNQGMEAVGELFSSGKYFISQLIYSAEILKTVMKKLEPILENSQSANLRGKVVIGTVKGDIHDIGKNIVVALLRGAGFEVLDLGVDVEPERFLEAMRESQAKVMGLSALLSTAYPAMKTVVDTLKEAGIRDRVKVIIGGAPCNEQVREFSGADYYSKDAVEGVNLCKKIYV
jgi:methylmalonyl-CoA mutase cobalamin-binding domain/chain